MRRPILFKVWSVLITMLGLWYVSQWLNSAPIDRAHYTLGIGIFCVVMGLGALAFSLLGPKRYDD